MLALLSLVMVLSYVLMSQLLCGSRVFVEVIVVVVVVLVVTLVSCVVLFMVISLCVV